MNTLFKNITSVVPDGAGGFKTIKGDVCVSGELISGVGRVPEGFVADRTVDGAGKLLIPGLINAHTHVYMTVFRNYADDLDFTDWLFGRILPIEDKLVYDDHYWATKLGYMEMLATGTTCSLDMNISINAAPNAQQECGIRAVLSRGLTGGADDAEGGERRLREALTEIETWKGAKGLTFMLAPHAPYTCDPGYLREVAAAADKAALPMNIHMSESLDELDTIRQKYGMSPPEYLDSVGVLRRDTVCAHCVHLSKSDVALMAARGVSVASNPVSNLKLGNGTADIPALMKAGVNVAIGTDGTASNNTLNMIREMSFMSLLHKGAHGDASLVSAQETFRMATVGGAKALGLEGVTGEIREGLQADLVMLDLDKPWLRPHNDLIASLCYSMNGSEVELTMVAGKVLYEKGEFLTIDAEETVRRVEASCDRLGTRR